METPRLSRRVADGCELIVILGGYFDESERQDGNEAICVGGYVFRPNRYVRFAREWRKLLESFGLSHLHMTDLYAGKDEYDGLGDARGRILEQAVGLIDDHILAGIAVLFDQKEFVASAPPAYAQQGGSIYSTACQICMRVTNYWLHAHDCRQLVAYSFEGGHRFEAEAGAIMRRLRDLPGVEETHSYDSHAFADKKRAAGLQAADVLAWTVSRARVGFPRNKTMAMFRPHLLALAKDSNRYQISVFSRSTLARFFDEQADRPRHYYFKRPSEIRGRLR